jgi:hypothetical protein
MSSLASLEDNTPAPYQLKVMSELLTQAHILGLDLEEMIEFLASQVQAMLSCPPNYNFMNEKKRVWILRGFYPGSPLFFKLTVCSLADMGGPGGYFAKASPMRVVYTNKRTKTRSDDHVSFNGNTLNSALTDRMENTFFGAQHEVKSLLSKGVKMPRCMSPKGMKLLRCNIKKRKNAKAK